MPDREMLKFFFLKVGDRLRQTTPNSVNIYTIVHKGSYNLMYRTEEDPFESSCSQRSWDDWLRRNTNWKFERLGKTKPRWRV